MCAKTPLEALAYLTKLYDKVMRNWVKDLNMRAIIAALIEGKAKLAVCIDLETWEYLGDQMQTSRELLDATEGLVLGNSPLECTVQSQLTDIQECLSIARDFCEIVYSDFESYVKD